MTYTTTTANTPNTNFTMTRASYVPSTYSESTTYSVDEQKMSHSTSPSKSSFRSKVKEFLSSVGEDPTAHYDREHGIPHKKLYFPTLPPSRT
jgi:hypothetical protein